MICIVRGEMVRTAFWDAGKEISAVVVWKLRWSWWSGSYGEGRAVLEVRRVSDSDDSCIVFFWRGCAEVGLWVCSAKWTKFGRKTVFL